MNEKLKDRLDKIKGELSPQCSLTAKSLLIAIGALEEITNSIHLRLAKCVEKELIQICDTWEGK